MSEYQELLRQRDDLDQKIAAAKKTEIESAISEAREIIETFGLTERDMFPAPAATKKRGSVAAKYRSLDGCSTWSGRGRPPLWYAEHVKHGGLASDLFISN
jgi:DNA-binding protein H-NS